MILGAHVSAAGGLINAVKKADLIGAQAIQIFASPPQNFNSPNHSSESIAEFNAGVVEKKLGPIFLHAIYLINLASPNPELVRKSVKALTDDLVFADKISAVGVIYHTGSTLGREFKEVLPQVKASMKNILDGSPLGTKLIVENAAGQGGTVGRSFTQIGEMVKDFPAERVGSCLDTQHAFASGYDIRTKEGLDQMLADWNREVGLDRLACLHINDSKVELGSGRDRHENIGQGVIGLEAFRVLKENSVTGSLPWIIEVPGFDDKGPDAANLDTLRSL